MVLYHAVSSYQLLCVMVHRLANHKGENAVLILPDFIIDKYPQYARLVELEIFDEVYLFPYLHIPHNPDTILTDVINAFEKLVTHNIEDFSKVYVAGAHFYFSLYLICKNVQFSFFEDAAGMLSKSDKLYSNLKVNFPINAEIAKTNGLFDGRNKLVREIFLFKKAQAEKIRYCCCKNFDVIKTMKKLKKGARKSCIHFFISVDIPVKKRSTVLLTEHFSNLGIMTAQEQLEVYANLKERLLFKGDLIIKPHPDDNTDYSSIFPDALVLKEKFPSELLPFIFSSKPSSVVTISSTGVHLLRKYFKVKSYY